MVIKVGSRGMVLGTRYQLMLHEHGFNSRWIELQLAHVDKNTIQGTYNHAVYRHERATMMQYCADLLLG